MSLKIRLHGLPADVAAATATLRNHSLIEVLSESRDHPDHARSRYVRRYLDVEIIGVARGEGGAVYCPHCGSNLQEDPDAHS